MNRYRPPKGTRILPKPWLYGPEFIEATPADWERLGSLIDDPRIKLGRRQRMALQMRCGLNGEPRRSFPYIARALGLNEEQARGCVAGAIVQVRRPHNRRLWLHAATA